MNRVVDFDESFIQRALGILGNAKKGVLQIKVTEKEISLIERPSQYFNVESTLFQCCGPMLK